MRKDGIFGLVLVELIFVDVFLERVEDLGRNVESGVADEFDQRQEGSSQRERDWKRLSLKRSTGSTRRRVDTWLSEKRDEGPFVYNQGTRSGRSGGIRMAVMSARSALYQIHRDLPPIFGSDSCAGTVGNDEQKSTNWMSG